MDKLKPKQIDSLDLPKGWTPGEKAKWNEAIAKMEDYYTRPKEEVGEIAKDLKEICQLNHDCLGSVKVQEKLQSLRDKYLSTLSQPIRLPGRKEIKDILLKHSVNAGDYIPDYNYDKVVNALSDVAGLIRRGSDGR